MKIQITDGEYKNVTTGDVFRIIITDSKGNRYRIKEDTILGSIEIMAEDGRISVLPGVSNVIHLKTIGYE